MPLKINKAELAKYCRKNDELESNPNEWIEQMKREISKKNLRIIKLINKEYKIKDITVTHYCEPNTDKKGVKSFLKFMVICENDEYEYDTYFVFYQKEFYNASK